MIHLSDYFNKELKPCEATLLCNVELFLWEWGLHLKLLLKYHATLELLVLTCPVVGTISPRGLQDCAVRAAASKQYKSNQTSNCSRFG